MTPTWDRHTVPSIVPALIGRLEGCRLSAHWDPLSKQYDIGFGSLTMPNGAKVRASDHLTQDQANGMCVMQCEKWALAVFDAITWPLTEIQAAVCISFVHNLGPNALHGSTLAAMANAGKLALAADQLNGWCIAGGQIALGLMRRREYERRLFMGEAAESQAAYNAVWQMDMHDLMPAYQRAFSEARAWGWHPNTTVQAITPPAARPVGQVSPQQSTEDLNDASLASAQQGAA